MESSTARRWSAGLLLLVLPVLAAWLGAPSATAASHDGPCTEPTGVTVVVDHQGLGGGVIVRCAVDFPASGGNGLKALQLAGFTPAGTVKDGAGFVCRINNRPAAEEDLSVGGQNYRESCISTPPDDAFWSYWHAPAGGQWTFSQLGAARSVKPGGYEGWSFSLGRTDGTNPPPGVKPAALPEPKPSPKPPTPANPSTPASKPDPTSVAPPPAPVTTPNAPATSHPASPSSRATSAAATTAPSQSPSSTSPSVTPSPTPTATTSGSPTATPTDATTSASATASATEPQVSTQPAAAESAPQAPEEVPGGGPGAGTFIGAGAVVAIAAAGGVVWWRRRSMQ